MTRERLPIIFMFCLAAGAAWMLIGVSDPTVAQAMLAPLPTDQSSPVAPDLRMNAPGVQLRNGAQASAQKTIPAPKHEQVLRAEWGSQAGQLGRKRPSEGNPEAPMSFTVDETGRIAVLDQVNQRVQIFDGQGQPAVVALPGDTYQDITLDPDGNVVVMDRLSRRSIETYGSDGSLKQQIPLEGDGVPQGGGVTGLFHRPDGTWVEVEHSRVVRVADENGQPDQVRPMLPGRFSADGSSLISALRESRESAIVLIQPASAPKTPPELLARVTFPLPLAHLVALESDAKGRIYLGAVLMLTSPEPPFEVVQVMEEVVVLSAYGQQLARVQLPARLGPEEQFRPLRLGQDGAFYQLHCDDNGVAINKVVL